MTQKEKMLYRVLDDEGLMSFYDYSKEDYEDLNLFEAVNSDNPIIAATARVINELKGSSDALIQKQVYKKLFSYLNQHLLV